MSAATSDTPQSVDEFVADRWRGLSASQRFELVAALNESCEQMAAAGVRLRHPSAGEGEVQRRVVALRLGRDLMIDVYGWDPDIEGW